jgi:hypothetical protein
MVCSISSFLDHRAPMLLVVDAALWTRESTANKETTSILLNISYYADILRCYRFLQILQKHLARQTQDVFNLPEFLQWRYVEYIIPNYV